MEEKIKPKIAIGIAYHKKGIFHKKYPYIPIQVGAKLADTDLGIQRDDVGDNISHLNPYYSELSATYWLWKNVKDVDYVGLFHYRRFLTFKSNSIINRLPTLGLYFASKIAAVFIQDSRCFYPHFSTINIQDKQSSIFLSEFVNDLMIDIDMNKIDCYTLGEMRHSTRTMRTHLNLGVGAKHFEYLEPLIKAKYPIFNKYFQKTLNGNKLIGYNILIAKKNIYDEYCDITFKILKDYQDFLLKNIDENSINNAILRDFGYVGEILLDSFIKMKVSKDKIKHRKINSLFVVDAIPTGMSYLKIPVYKRIIQMLKK